MMSHQTTLDIKFIILTSEFIQTSIAVRFETTPVKMTEKVATNITCKIEKNPQKQKRLTDQDWHDISSLKVGWLIP